MLKLYGELDTDFLSVRVFDIPVSREIQNIYVNHIPKSDNFVTFDQGADRTLSLSIGCTTTAERDSVLDFVHTKLKRITFDDVKYMDAVYKGGSRNWPVTPITKLLKVPIMLQVSAFQYSFVLNEKTADLALPNSGNARSIPTFEITGEATTAAITISDGIRTLTCAKALLATDVLKISDYQALLNGEDISDTLSGNYPQIDKNQTDFTLTITGITASKVTVKYRDTWR